MDDDLPDGWTWETDHGHASGLFEITYNGKWVATLGLHAAAPFASEIADGLTRLLAALGE